MIQGTLAPAAPDTVRVPLPDAFEQWRDLYLHGAVQKVLVFLILALLLYLLARLARRQITHSIEDVNRRHILRKWVGYLYAVFLLLFGVALFADMLTGVGTILAVLIAGVAVALQDVLKSVVGWLYLSSRAGIEIGCRVEVEGVRGDVIDVGVLKTTLLEIGNLVYGMQSTGRLITVPNYRMLTEAVIVSGADNPFVWHEVRVLITYESDWQRAEAILREIGDELHAEVAPDLERGFRRLERRYAFKYGTLTPIVYLSLADSGVQLTLRVLVNVRRRRGTEDRVSRRILTTFAADPSVELAYPTYRVYRAGEAAPHHSSAPPPPAAPVLEPGGEEGLPPPELLTGDPG